jgi:hypothetical protein
MERTLHVPISMAERKGISAVAEMSGTARVALTSHGRVVAVVDSADRVDAQAREIREASWAVVEAAADLVAGRTRRFTLDEVCAKAGVSADRVRERAAQMRARGESPDHASSEDVVLDVEP